MGLGEGAGDGACGPAPAAPIARLAPDVANQLAAGEVVERPASALKELVENSLDAGATRLEVELDRGGVREIRVTDDGGGIRREDLGLALERHATSKVASLDDLYRVASLGFRGEALASIAAVSRLTLTSRTADDPTGWSLGGDGGAPRPSRHSVGTTVEVRDLFYNTPARRKFLRAERTELHHAMEVLRRLALARPDVAFRVRHAGRGVFRTGTGGGRLDEVLGRGFAESAALVEAEAEGLHLRGWIGPGSPEREYFFLNGRAVRDRAVGHALRIALDGLVPPGKSIVCVLFLTMDPALVDVNVHPGKHEVRFWQPRTVHDFLVAALRRTLSGADAFEGHLHVAEERPAAPSYSPSSRGDLFVPPRPFLAARPGASSGRARAGRPPLAAAPSGRRAAAPAMRSSTRDGASAVWVAERYAILERNDRVLAIDVARALEEGFRDAAARATSATPLPSFPLLVPVRVRIAEEALDRFEPDEVAHLGFVVRRVGPDTISLLEIPRELRHADPATVGRALVETPAARLPARLAAAAARVLPADPSERSRLLDTVIAGAGPALVPPLAVEIGIRDIERLFGR